MSLLLAMLLQVGPNPLSGGMQGDDLVRDRPARSDTATLVEMNAASAWFTACLDQIEIDPARAHSMAQIRSSETSGEDFILANFCLGTAATQLALWDDAREAFQLAKNALPVKDKRARARFGAMAGNAALASGKPDLALFLLEAAAEDAHTADAAPLEAVARIDTARALVLLNRSNEALAALENAVTLAPERSEGWLLKATLLRRMVRLGEAQAAIERAAVVSSENPEIGIEAGVIAVLSGREDAARQSWQSVIAHAPHSQAAAIAQEYLAQLPPAEETLPTAPPIEE